MTDDEKLDLILQEYKDRLSRHHPPGIWEDIAKKVCGGTPASSAYGIYINKLFQDGLLERDINSDVVASHKGLNFSYVKESKRKRSEKRWNRFTRITSISAFIISLISIGLTLKKELKEDKESGKTISHKDSLQTDTLKSKK